MRNLVFLGTAILLAGVFWGCGGGGGSSPTPVNANVVGQLSLPEAHDLPQFEVYLDVDQNPLNENGFVKKVVGICQCQLLIDYMFVDTPAGIYYLYGIVRINSKDGTAPVAGDFMGFYTGTSNPAVPTPIVVTASGKVDNALINLQLVTPQ